MLPVLLARCEANLIVKVPDDQLPEAATVREDILGEFSELFASDGTGKDPDELDFYECKFNRAFRFFRIDVVRRETGRIKHVAQMPEPDKDGAPEPHDEVFARVSEAFRSPATQDSDVFRSELHDAILALLWQKVDFWDSLCGRCMIHRVPAFIRGWRWKRIGSGIWSDGLSLI